tara:strand:- start:5943 stop:7964 length:2022 start_codon:yes stop_codon:yes gene_type:complete
MSEEQIKRIEDKAKKLNIKNAPTKEEGLNNFDRIRLFSQGLSMNFSDEAIAGFQSLYSDKSYDELIKIERDLIEKARTKDGSLKYEIGGALTTGILTMPFTFGASLPVTGARAMAIAGTSGLVSSVGEKEGDVVERIVENPINVAVDTTLSAIAGPIFSKTVDVGGKVIKGTTGKLKRAILGQIGKKAEDEIVRIANTAGIPIEEVIEEVGKGKTFPELSPEVATEIRAIYSKGTAGAGQLRDSLTKREDKNIKSVVDTTIKGLAPKKGSANILDLVQKSTKEVKKLESEAYNKIFQQYDNLSDENLNNLVLNIVNSYEPQRLTKDVNRILKAKGLPTLFEKTKDGYILSKDINLETGESIYRIIRDKALELRRMPKNEEADVVTNLAMSLKNKLDEISPELKNTRANWAKIELGSDLFEEGNKLLGKNVDEAEIRINEVINLNDAELLNSFREGIARSIKNKISKSRTAKNTFIRDLNRPDSKERIILTKIFPKNQLDDLLTKGEIAEGSIMAKGKILGGSPTAITQERVKNIGTVEDASNLASVISGNFLSGIPLIKKFLPEKTKGLSDKQLEQVVQLIVTEDAELLKKALTDINSRQLALQKLNTIINVVRGGTASASGQTTATNVSFDEPNINFSLGALASEQNDAVPEFVKGLSTSAKRKIMQTLDST